MPLNKALICGFVIDRSGRATPVDSAGVDAWTPEAGWLWVHIDRSHDEAERWLAETANLDPLAVEALVADETRPRSVAIGDGMLVILRGVNLNAGADPEDMIAVRLWVEPMRIFSIRARRLMAIQDLRTQVEAGDVPPTPGAMMVRIADLMIDRMGPVLDEINDTVDQVEEDVVDAPSHESRAKIARLRRQAISLRRFLAPQREVLARLHSERTAILSDADRSELREVTERLTRSIEELDAAKDRAAVTQEELGGRISEQMNKNMYVLSIVAGIFLPLGLFTGLLGINVGGMPGVENDRAFAIVCIILLGLAGAAFWVFRRLRLL